MSNILIKFKLNSNPSGLRTFEECQNSIKDVLSLFEDGTSIQFTVEDSDGAEKNFLIASDQEGCSKRDIRDIQLGFQKWVSENHSSLNTADNG